MRPPPSVRDAAFLFLVVVAAMILAGSLFARAGLAGLAAAEVLAVGGPVLLFARLREVSLGLARPAPAHAAGGAGVGVSLWLLLVVLVLPLQEQIAPAPEELKRDLARMVLPDEPLVFIVLAVAVLPAICEELLCRGVLCRALAARWGNAAGVIGSATLFAGLHGSVYRLVPTFLLGLSLGWMTLRSRSIVPSMIAHAGHNAAIVVVSDPRLTVGPWLEAHQAIALLVAVGLVTTGHALFFSPSRVAG